jgi:hypothetical protein
MGQPQSRRAELLMRLQRQLTRQICGRSVRSMPLVIIVKADDIVLTEVVAVLDLNEHQRNWASVLDAVSNTTGDVDSISRADLDGAAVKGDDPVPGDHEPVLGTARMRLVTEALAGTHLERLDLEAVSLSDYRVETPRTFGVLSHPTIVPDSFGTGGKGQK